MGRPLYAFLPLVVALALPCLQLVMALVVGPTTGNMVVVVLVRVFGFLVAVSSLVLNFTVVALTSWTHH